MRRSFCFNQGIDSSIWAIRHKIAAHLCTFSLLPCTSALHFCTSFLIFAHTSLHKSASLHMSCTSLHMFALSCPHMSHIFAYTAHLPPSTAIFRHLGHEEVPLLQSGNRVQQCGKFGIKLQHICTHGCTFLHIFARDLHIFAHKLHILHVNCTCLHIPSGKRELSQYLALLNWSGNQSTNCLPTVRVSPIAAPLVASSNQLAEF